MKSGKPHYSSSYELCSLGLRDYLEEVFLPKVPCSGRLIVVTGKGPRGKRERRRFIIERIYEGPGIISHEEVTKMTSLGSVVTRR